MHIYLIGMPACGKSYRGKTLAADLGYAFLDLDERIVQNSGKSIREIFKESGEQAFRIIEKKCLLSIDPAQNYVVATGGGTPCFFDNIKEMNQRGLTVYLKIPVEILAKRIASKPDKRPLFKDVSEDALIPALNKMLKERESFYEKARLHIQVSECSQAKLTETIRQFLHKKRLLNQN